MTTKILVWTTLVNEFLNVFLKSSGLKLAPKAEVDTIELLDAMSLEVRGFATVSANPAGLTVRYEGLNQLDTTVTNLNNRVELTCVPWSLVLEVVSQLIPIEKIKIASNGNYEYGVFDELGLIGTIRVYPMQSGLECEFVDAEAYLRVCLTDLVAETYIQNGGQS